MDVGEIPPILALPSVVYIDDCVVGINLWTKAFARIKFNQIFGYIAAFNPPTWLFLQFLGEIVAEFY